jgi:hypothetical protein
MVLAGKSRSSMPAPTAKSTRPHAVEVVRAPAAAKIATFGPSKLLETVAQRPNSMLRFRIILGRRHQHTDVPHPLGLLPARHLRPRDRAAE